MPNPYVAQSTPADEYAPKKTITLIPASEWPADKPFPVVQTPFSGPDSGRA